jgi:nucleoside-diphosphate-sugar epimerase
MKDNITIIGSSGFIGKNLKKYLSNEFICIDQSLRFKKNQSLTFKSKSIIHLAGIAHDLSKRYTYDDYFKSNYQLTKQVFDGFLKSQCKIFIYISSVKAVTDSVDGLLTESTSPKPLTNYGITKLLSENYIINQKVPKGKKVFILRPCMIHGPHNKGNLNLLYKLCSKNIPWPLGVYENKRSFCFIDNFSFVINQLLSNNDIKSGIYNISDDLSISTNDLISLIFNFQKKNPKILKVPMFLVKFIVLLGDILRLPLNSQTLKKLTESYEVSNKKIKESLSIKSMPISLRDGLKLTFNYLK